MDKRLGSLTLGVRDLARSRAFYKQGLGWTRRFDARSDRTPVAVDRYRLMTPRRAAWATASVRPVASSLSRSELTWNLAV